MKYYFSKRQAIYIADIIDRYIREAGDTADLPLARNLSDYLRNGGEEISRYFEINKQL